MASLKTQFSVKGRAFSQSLKLSIIRFTGSFAQYNVTNAIKDEMVNLEPCPGKGDSLSIGIYTTASLNQCVHKNYICPTTVAVANQCNQLTLLVYVGN